MEKHPGGARRARRRAERERAIRRVIEWLKYEDFNRLPSRCLWIDAKRRERRLLTWDDLFEWRRLHAVCRHRHRQVCSSPMCCGNRRAAAGPTLQERRAATADEDWG